MNVQLLNGEVISSTLITNMFKKKKIEQPLKCVIKMRTLEEVANLFDIALDIKRLRGKNHLWQVKLEKLRLYGNEAIGIGYIICRASSPNAAMDLLCQKISYKTVVGPKVKGKHKILALGLVQRKPLYLRYSGSENE